MFYHLSNALEKEKLFPMMVSHVHYVSHTVKLNLEILVEQIYVNQTQSSHGQEPVFRVEKE